MKRGGMLLRGIGMLVAVIIVAMTGCSLVGPDRGMPGKVIDAQEHR